MTMLATALSAFSARATRDRRLVLLGYSALVAVAMLGVAQLISVSALRDGTVVNALELADLFALFVLACGLFVVAPAMVAAQVAEERRQGTLDLLRTAPLSPTALTAGFLVGAPGTLYLVLAGPLLLHLSAGLFGSVPVSVVLGSVVVLGLGGIVLMLGAVIGALTLNREGGGGAAPMLIAALLAVAALTATSLANTTDAAPWASIHPAGALALLYQSFDGLYHADFVSSYRATALAEPRLAATLSVAPLFGVLAYVLGGLLLLSAARRALARETPSPLAKHEAIGLFALASLLLLIPLRATLGAYDLRVDHLGCVTFALLGPYLACVLGTTPSASAWSSAPNAPRLSPRGAPHLAALLMVTSAIAITAVLFGKEAWSAISQSYLAGLSVGIALLALTLPIYAQFAATRIGTAPGRGAFWALIAVHIAMQIPAIGLSIEGHDQVSDGPRLVLAHLDLAFGVALPLFLAWRQHVANRLVARGV